MITAARYDDIHRCGGQSALRPRSAVLLFVLTACMTGCSGYSPTGGPGKLVNPSLVSQSAQPRDLLTINSMLVAPPEIERRTQMTDEQRRALFGRVFDAFVRESGVQVVDRTIVEKNGAVFSENAARAGALAFARRHGADSVLFTRVNDLVQRDGSSVGADQGAKLDMTYELVRTADSKVVWEANYYFRDQFLSENILRLKQNIDSGKGLSWKSSEDLLTASVDTASQDFAARRVAQFSPRR